MDENLRELERLLIKTISEGETKMKNSTLGWGEGSVVMNPSGYNYGLGAYDTGHLTLQNLYKLFPQLKE